jgi:hypothetical protein
MYAKHTKILENNHTEKSKSYTDNDDHQQWYKEEIIQPVYEKMQELEMPTNILLHIDNIKGFL